MRIRVSLLQETFQTRKLTTVMKILHTSDWHLGDALYNIERTKEHEVFLQQLKEIMLKRKPDAVVVSGDIFDSSQPSLAAQRLYNRMMIEIAQSNPDTLIVVTAGNHDSASKMELNSELWDKALGVKVISKVVKQTDEPYDWDKHIVEVPGKGYIIAVPYASGDSYPAIDGKEGTEHITRFHQTLLDKVEERNTGKLPVVMMDHLAIASCDASGHDLSKGRLIFEEQSLLGEGYDYLALGHIHKPQTLAHGKEQTSRARYCGSPIPVSFDEDYDHSVTLVSIDAHGQVPKIEPIPIRNVMPIYNLPKKAGDLVDVLAAIDALPAGAEGYARVNIKVDNILPMEDRLAIESRMSSHPGVRLCTINLSRAMSSAATGLKTYTPDELKQSVDPIQIAKDYYEATHNGEAMSGTLISILEKIVKEVENESENEN